MIRQTKRVFIVVALACSSSTWATPVFDFAFDDGVFFVEGMASGLAPDQDNQTPTSIQLSVSSPFPLELDIGSGLFQFGPTVFFLFNTSGGEVTRAVGDGLALPPLQGQITNGFLGIDFDISGAQLATLILAEQVGDQLDSIVVNGEINFAAAAPAEVPEPSSLMLVLTGLVALRLRRSAGKWKSLGNGWERTSSP